MRTSQAESIREPLEQAINAINDFFVQVKKSEQSATEFEKIFAEGAASSTERKLATQDDRREDLRTMLELPPKAKKALDKYLAQQKEAMVRLRISRPMISSYYPWRHCVAESAGHLAKCGWTTEAEAIYRALDGLPNDNGFIDWTQPGMHQEIRAKVIDVANHIRDILTACRKEIFPAKHFIELLELHTPIQRLTVGCGRIWKKYKESQHTGQRQGNSTKIEMSEAYPRARDLDKSLTLEDFKHYAKEGTKPNGRFKEWVHGSKGEKIPIEKFFE